MAEAVRERLPVDADHRRALVPSRRETEDGGVEYAFNPPPPPPEQLPLGTRVRRGLRQYRTDMSPRTWAVGATIWPVVVFAALEFLLTVSEAATSVVYPDLRDYFNVDLSAVLAMAGAGTIVGFAFFPWAAFISDRKNRIWIARLGNLAYYGVGGVFAGLSNNPVLFGLGKAVSGVGQVFGGEMKAPLFRDWYRPSVQARVLIIAGLGATFAGVTAPFVVGHVDEAIGPMRTIVAIGVAGMVASLGLFLLREPERGAQERAELGVAEAPPMEPPPTMVQAFRSLAGIQTLRRLWLALPLICFAGFGINFYMGLYYFNVYRLGPADRGLMLSISALGGVPAGIILAPVIDRLIKKSPGSVLGVVSGLLVLEGAATFAMSLVDSKELTAVIGIAPAMLSSLFFSLVLFVVIRITPFRLIGAGVGSIFPPLVIGIVFVVPFILYASSQFGWRTGMKVLLPVDLLAAFVVARIAPFVDKDIRSAQAYNMASKESKRAKEEGRSKMLICRQVEVFYDAAQVLFGVDLDIEEGEIVALLGTNGAGKSTLLKAIAGVHAATYGAIFLDGEDISHNPAHVNAEQGIVFMPGGRAVFPTMTVEENLRAAAFMYRDDEAYLKERRAEIFALFPRLRERLGVMAGDMSGGEQQMLALGQALLMKPRLLMIDELSLGLAPQVVQQLLDALRRIHAGGTTVVLVEQSINVALSIAERAVYMEKGEVRFDGPTRDLFTRSDIVRSVFLGKAVTSSLGPSQSRALDAAQARETVLEVDQVHLAYGGVSVLNGVSLTVERAEVVGIVGPNGAGKTTLFDAIAGSAQVSEGTVRLLGTDVTSMPADARARMGIARSFQNVRLFPALTVRENIAVALERHLENRSAVMAAVWSPATRRVERRVHRRVDNLIDSLSLGPFADKFVNELSTGTRRIVDIACVLAAQPRLLLLDEPSSGLAQAETEQLAPVIARIVQETNCALLVIEHDLGLISAVSDRLVAMRLGAVMAEGRPRAVLENEEVVDALLGGASEAVLNRSLQVAPAGPA
ncbi:MAG: hypothetical protein QOK05_682 [Chloroflexota bacterium]|jgi:branched-chain amino acid transport system ATP-binding protein|nr:hypothetical protein [Chloroflexota bacterium]